MDLEEQLESAYNELSIEPQNRERINVFLSLIKQRDPETYAHSIRVGLRARKIAQYMHIDEKALFYVGTLHDVGKSLIDSEILRKTEGFNEQDMQKMRAHPQYGYHLLRGICDFSAEIALRHHRFQENLYPKRVPCPSKKFSRNTALLVEHCARLIALTDFYDAASFRVNNKFGEEKEKLSGTQVKELLLKKNLDQKKLIEELYQAGIFQENKPYDEKTLEVQAAHYASLSWPKMRTPQETRRHIALALALEPIPPKTGCTSRLRNASRHLKLEYFVTAAINAIDAFEKLAHECTSSTKNPKQIYALLYRAQHDGIRNRTGGRINQGALEVLFPLVAAQMQFNKEYNLETNVVLEYATQFMKNTTRGDVNHLIAMKQLAYDLSGYHNRKIASHPQAQTVYEYYCAELEEVTTATSKAHNEEFVAGFPTVSDIYTTLRNAKGSLHERMEESYEQARLKRHKNVSAGVTADHIAAGLYLLFSQHPREQHVT